MFVCAYWYLSSTRVKYLLGKSRSGVFHVKANQCLLFVEFRYQEIFSGQERVPGMEFLHMGEVKTENVVSGISNEVNIKRFERCRLVVAINSSLCSFPNNKRCKCLDSSPR